MLYEYEPVDDQVISTEVARRATVALQAVVSGGTYKGGSLPDRRPAAGKTGTNELDDGGNADVWFVGFTPQIATAVWIGNPAGSLELKGSGVQGGTAAGKVWREFMFPYLDGTPVVDFTDPLSIGKSTYIKDPWSRYSTRSSSSSSSRSGSSSTRRSSSGASGSTRNAPRPLRRRSRCRTSVVGTSVVGPTRARVAAPRPAADRGVRRRPLLRPRAVDRRERPMVRT